MSALKQTGFVPELEATRGIAALLVAGAHAAAARVILDGETYHLSKSGMIVDNSMEAFLSVFFRGFLAAPAAVQFFFVLSGFVLTASLERGFPPCLRTAWQFAISRVFRIYPGIIVTVLLFDAWYLLTGLTIDVLYYDPVLIFNNMALLSVAMNGVMWSIQVELLATPAIFLAFILARKIGRLAVVAFALVLLLLAFQEWWLKLIPLPGGIPRTKYFYVFILGSVGFYYGRSIVERIPPRHLLMWIVVALVIVFTCSLDWAPEYWAIHTDYAHLGLSLASTVLVVIVAFGGCNITKGWLNSPFSRLFGRVSYSFYLLHPLSLTVLWHMPGTWLGAAVNAGVPPSVLLLSVWIISSAAILPLAMLCYRYVELPGIELGRRLAGQRRANDKLGQRLAVGEQPTTAVQRNGRKSKFGYRVAGIWQPVGTVALLFVALTATNALRTNSATGSLPAKAAVRPTATLERSEFEGLSTDEAAESPILAGQRPTKLTSDPKVDTRLVTFTFASSAKHSAITGWLSRALFWSPESGKVYRAQAWIKPGTETLVLLTVRDDPRTTFSAAMFDVAAHQVKRQISGAWDSGIEVQQDGWIKIWTHVTSSRPDFIVQFYLYSAVPGTTLTLGGVMVEERSKLATSQ